MSTAWSPFKSVTLTSCVLLIVDSKFSTTTQVAQQNKMHDYTGWRTKNRPTVS